MEVAGAKKALQMLSGNRLKNIFGCVAVVGVAVVAGEDEWGGGRGCERWWWLVWPDAVVAGGGAVNDGVGGDRSEILKQSNSRGMMKGTTDLRHRSCRGMDREEPKRRRLEE
ncbi:hypothetical protein E3N88_10023 [Mikania micrantha]|uniref:Uncharacterized protein n=1 Tax=Mikania micrantha TaxID=192012 RepID=A0A5N6PB79_9ASTR|nr:hypothetical protein E3N88_10023 [Mikania micrantha]